MRSDLKRPFFVLCALLAGFAASSEAEISAPILPGDAETICTELEQIDGFAVVEGDIVLGPCRQNPDGSWAFTPRGPFAALATGLPDPKAAVVTPSGYWPDGIVPYVISDSFSQANDPVVHSQILSAIRHWRGRSVVRLVPRTDEPHYVEFVPSSGCSSYLGRVGGRQQIWLAPGGGCGFGSTVHEIGHALGFYHEQSRQDRDAYVTIEWDQIQAGREHNFSKYSLGLDLDAYNYGSIMHYGEGAFAIDENRPTIIPNQVQYDAWRAIYGDIPIGQRLELSVLDRQAADTMYNVCWDGAAAEASTWQANPWRACSSSCESPGRTREVFCHSADGSCASDLECAAPRPSTFDSCADLLSCDFDVDSCGWDPVAGGDDFNWTPSYGPTRSSGTGPSADHTGGGYFLYTEMSSPRLTGDTAFLSSPPVDIPGGTTLTFWYHYHGTSLGTLEVEVAPCDGSPQTVLTISPENTASLDEWRQASVELPAASNAQIRFVATRDSSWSSDIAIDDISLGGVGPLFSDDFETGVLDAWSSTLP